MSYSMNGPSFKKFRASLWEAEHIEHNGKNIEQYGEPQIRHIYIFLYNRNYWTLVPHV